MAQQRNLQNKPGRKSKTNGKRTSPKVRANGSSGQSNPLADHQRIAKLAYTLWLNEGCPSGREKANWHQAEREL